jgi:ABC-2 type transport system permease protein
VIAAIRSESLRSISGLSLTATYILAIVVPVVVLTSDRSLTDLTGLSDGAATAQLLQPLAWSFIIAAFVGAYTVTREYYYASMDRTLTELGYSRAFWGKMVAGVITSVGLALCTFAIWTVVAFFILKQEGLAVNIDAAGLRIYAGALVGVILGSFIGGAVGWISHNYYIGAAIVLAFPIGVEFALLGSSPEIARFSPGMAIAALGVPEFRDRLLEFGPAAGIAAAWTVGLVLVAWFAGRRRVA